MIENRENNSIESLWILERTSGICIFEENYVNFTKVGISSQIVASFLSALLKFAGEAFSDNVEFIKFSKRKMFFQFTKFFLFVIAINENDPWDETQVIKIRKTISKVFLKRFQDIFTNNKWEGDITVFYNFSEELNHIVEKKPLKAKFIQNCSLNKIKCKFFMKKHSNDDEKPCKLRNFFDKIHN
jgi:hypothetical protein